MLSPTDAEAGKPGGITLGSVNNQPVAWMDEDENVVFEKCKVYPIPLYTHPVKELDEQYEKGFKAGKEEGWKAHKFHHPVKEQDTDCQYCKQGCIRCDARKQLTDEEIFATALEQYGHSVGLYGNHIGFARAVLRKASEK
jgi:hypothetical protein